MNGERFLVPGTLARAIADYYLTSARVSESDPSVWIVADLYGGARDSLCMVYAVDGRLDLIANVCADSSVDGFTLDDAVYFIESAYGVSGAAGVIFEYVVPVSVCVRGGRVVWSNVEAGGSLACITDAITGCEFEGEEHDLILDAFGDVTDQRLRDVISE